MFVTKLSDRLTIQLVMIPPGTAAGYTGLRFRLLDERVLNKNACITYRDL